MYVLVSFVNLINQHTKFNDFIQILKKSLSEIILWQPGIGFFSIRQRSKNSKKIHHKYKNKNSSLMSNI